MSQSFLVFTFFHRASRSFLFVLCILCSGHESQESGQRGTSTVPSTVPSDHGGLAGCCLDVFHRFGSFLRLLFVKFCKQAHGLHIEIFEITRWHNSVFFAEVHIASWLPAFGSLQQRPSLSILWHSYGIDMAYAWHIQYTLTYFNAVWDLRLSICPNLNYQSSWKLSKVISPSRDQEPWIQTMLVHPALIRDLSLQKPLSRAGYRAIQVRSNHPSGRHYKCQPEIFVWQVSFIIMNYS